MKKNNKKGFTLVELVIVVAVMAILVAVAIPTVGAITGKAKTAVDESNAKTLESMIKLAEADAINDAKGGEATFGDQQIADAIAEAKLGIESGKFTYDASTGKVVVGDKTGAITGGVLIEFTTESNTKVVKVGTNGKANLSVTTTSSSSSALG